MPYIDESEREAIDKGSVLPSSSGQLTYLFYPRIFALYE